MKERTDSKAPPSFILIEWICFGIHSIHRYLINKNDIYKISSLASSSYKSTQRVFSELFSSADSSSPLSSSSITICALRFDSVFGLEEDQEEADEFFEEKDAEFFNDAEDEGKFLVEIVYCDVVVAVDDEFDFGCIFLEDGSMVGFSEFEEFESPPIRGDFFVVEDVEEDEGVVGRNFVGENELCEFEGFTKVEEEDAENIKSSAKSKRS